MSNLSFLEQQLAEAKRQAEIAKTYQEQPGYIWTVYLNNNSPYRDRTGHLGQVKGVVAVNGAEELLAEYGSAMKAWVYGADSIVGEHKTGSSCQYFTPVNFMVDEEVFPITEADSIVTLGQVTGKLYTTSSGEKVVLPLGQMVPDDYIPVQELIFKAYLTDGLVLGSAKAWDPQAQNIFKGQSGATIAERLKANSELFRDNQAKGLAGWRNKQQMMMASSVAAGVDAVVGAANAVATPAARRTRNKGV